MIRRVRLQRSHMTAKGPAARRTAAKRRKINAAERAAKQAAKIRDQFTCRKCGTWQGRMEAAHLVTKGMGGDHGRYSCEPKHFVTLCYDCHQGPRSVHSGHVHVVWGEAMGDGPVEFVVKKIA